MSEEVPGHFHKNRFPWIIVLFVDIKKSTCSLVLYFYGPFVRGEGEGIKPVAAMEREHSGVQESEVSEVRTSFFFFFFIQEAFWKFQSAPEKRSVQLAERNVPSAAKQPKRVPNYKQTPTLDSETLQGLCQETLSERTEQKLKKKNETGEIKQTSLLFLPILPYTCILLYLRIPIKTAPWWLRLEYP